MTMDADEESRRYRAPALEKGLDILELVSRASRPMTVIMIAQALGRSSSELFRMIQVLEYRGFIVQAEGGTGYVPTSKLFSLGMEQAPVKSLIEIALPIMRKIAEDSDQSCHLALRAGGDIVIAARMESAGLIGFSVRIGYRLAIPLAGSGSVLYAFQSEQTQRRWAEDFDHTLSKKTLSDFQKRVRKVSVDGYDIHPSESVPGIIDLAAPILRGAYAAAALTSPFVQKRGLKATQDEVLAMVREAATEISSHLVASDVRA